MRNLPLVLLILVATTAWGDPSDSADQRTIDEILAQPAIDFPHAAWLIGRAAGTFDDTIDPGSASKKAIALGWGAASPPGTPVSVATYSQILVKALGFPTGWVYNLFPGPRYAFRELTFRRIVPGALDSASLVTGEAAFRYLQAAQDWQEAHR